MGWTSVSAMVTGLRNRTPTSYTKTSHVSRTSFIPAISP